MFSADTVEDGYVIYRENRKLQHWEVLELLEKLPEEIKPHNCKNCRYFRHADYPKHGTCEHPLMSPGSLTFDINERKHFPTFSQTAHTEHEKIYVGEYFGCMHFDDKP